MKATVTLTDSMGVDKATTRSVRVEANEPSFIGANSAVQGEVELVDRAPGLPTEMHAQLVRRNAAGNVLEGMEFTRGASFDGAFQWVQTITITHSRRRTESGITENSGGSGLDNVYPYSNLQTTTDTPHAFAYGSESVYVDPVTAQILPLYDKVDVTWAGRMTLMFKSTNGNSDWVPLFEVYWTMEAHLAYNATANTWSLTKSETITDLLSTTSHPVWTQIFVNS